jgi:hypothetical protein
VTASDWAGSNPADSSRTTLAVAAGLRAAYGAALCCAPGVMLRLEGGAEASSAPHARAVARVLGGRHLAQAFLSVARPVPAILALSAGTDMLHSASMLALGALDRPRRRLGLTDGLIAAAFAAAGWALTRQRRASAERNGDWISGALEWLGGDTPGGRVD